MKPSFGALTIRTDAGEFTARYSERGLAELDFPSAKRAPSRAEKREATSTIIRRWHRATEAALKNILAGRPPRFFPPLDPAGTDFQKSVWNTLRKIPLGRT